MEVHSTSRCHEFAHPEISFDVAEVVPPERVDSLVAALESMVAAGSVFRPGESLQYGWSLLKFQSDGQGGLFLTEPDFSTRPIEFRGGVTQTLLTNMRQIYTLDSYGIGRGLLDFHRAPLRLGKLPARRAALDERGVSADRNRSYRGDRRSCVDFLRLAE